MQRRTCWREMREKKGGGGGVGNVGLFAGELDDDDDGCG